ncbi:MAG TPA: HAMP domain-containing sensor histidine kinase [Solirubrobacteraceae bacterium]|nr:HAMP domain-containing sensor histidine kinase [Solirubrobacteraceae bacterium]
MTALRHRLTVLADATVGVTVVLVAIIAYLVLRSELRGQVDEALKTQYAQVLRSVRNEGIARSRGYDLPAPSLRAGDPSGPVQLIAPGGAVIFRTPGADLTVPVDEADRALAKGVGDRVALRDARSPDGVHLRVLTVAFSDGGAIQVARSLANVDATLGRLQLVLILLCAGGTLLAAFFGRLFGNQVIQPVSELTAAAEHITQTNDLGRRIEVRSDDEVGQMAQRFNAMLDALERSRRALDESVHSQRQLVADASHELRTPVTSLRTNIEVLLAEGGELPADDRTRLLEDVRAETEELTALITDVIELARGDEPLQGVDDVQLDDVVAEAVARARRRRPRTTFDAALEPTVVEGLSERLGRAVDNLLDNAAKHAPEGTVVDVVLRGGELTVRDRGPGIPADEREHVFDRFYRGATARGRPGSGLGLAIVRQVAETHGGSISVEEAPGGGALFRLRLASAGRTPAPAAASGEQPEPAAPPAAP